MQIDKNELDIVVGSIPLGIIVTDTNLIVKYVNKSVVKMFNRTYDENIGKGPGDCICCINSFSSNKGCGHSLKCNDCKLRQTIKYTINNWVPSEAMEIENTVLENNIVKKLWFKITTTPIIENSKKFILITISNITEYKNSNNELIKLKDIAEAANRAKSEFLANMSHEIRTPLNGIIGMTDLTFSTNLSEEQKENLNIVKSCASTLLELINNILDLSKIEAGKVAIENVQFDSTAIIQKVIATNIAIANEKNIELYYNIDDEVPKMLTGDPYRLEQVLNNLMSNAVKFTQKGKVVLNVANIKKFDEIFDIQFAVEDTGIGISEDEMKFLFKSFSQVDASITREYGGTGLGLAISQKLVNLMGGNIDVESKKGKGTKFYFNLKLNQGKDIFEETKVDTNRNKNFKDLNILLLEDDMVNQFVIKRMLQEIGYNKIEIASNGIEGLKLIENHKFDMILMDIQMPQLDGTQTTEIIREKEKKSKIHIPIIAITAYALKGDREKFLSKGMDDYISKPVDINELSKTLNRVCSVICNNDNDIIESYLKTNEKRNMNDLIELDEGDRIYFSDSIKEMASYLEPTENTFNKYFQIERIAHDIKIYCEKGALKVIKDLGFKIELAARKKDEINIKNNYDNICSILKYNNK